MKEFDSKNVKKIEIILCKINAEKIEKKPSSTKFTITRVDKYEILEIKENAFSLKLNSSIFIDPEALFRVNLEHQIKYEFTHEIDTKFIENNLEEIFHPVGSEVSYITSTLTKFLTDSYIILPPTIIIEQENSKKQQK